MKRLIDWMFGRRAPEPPKLRNKPGGMAWIRGTSGLDLDGRAVRTLRLNEYGQWLIEPVQPIVARQTFTAIPSQIVYQAGDRVCVAALGDQHLEPWQDDGVTDQEVSELYRPAPVVNQPESI